GEAKHEDLADHWVDSPPRQLTAREDGRNVTASSPRRCGGTPPIRSLHELHEGLPSIEGVLDPEVVPVVAVEAVGVPTLRLGGCDPESERLAVPGAPRGL